MQMALLATPCGSEVNCRTMANLSTPKTYCWCSRAGMQSHLSVKYADTYLDDDQLRRQCVTQSAAFCRTMLSYCKH